MPRSRGWELPIAITALAVLGAGQAADAQVSVFSGHVVNGGIPLNEAAVYLVPLDDTEAPGPEPTAVVDQVHLTFQPSVVVITPGTEVRFFNSDVVLHNVFSPGSDGGGFDLGTYEQYRSRTHVFEREGVYVVLCHVHPEMAAYVVVAPTTYKAVSDADGTFEIQVPPGRYRLHAWHSRRWRDELQVEITVPPQGLVEQRIVLGPNSGIGGIR